MYEPLPLETQTLYAELLEHLLATRAGGTVGLVDGTFTEKTIKGERYVYFQASQPGGGKKQFYLGRKTPALDAIVERWSRERERFAPDARRTERLVAQLRVGGANVTDTASARVIRALADAGVFDAGGVLVGTHAFVALGNLLGVRWRSALRTQDVDVARAVDRDIDVAVPELQVDVPSVLDSLQMGFLPVPPLDPRAPSTSFKVRGQALRVDLLCPGPKADAPPVFLSRFGAAAQPLPHLGYLLGAPERVAVLNGGASLVNVPTPARFALHKLALASLRPAAMHAKRDKDLQQAVELLRVLVDERRGDLAVAFDAAGAPLAKLVRAAVPALAVREHALAHALTTAIGTRRPRGTRRP